ncbi:putative disease resistance proteinisoform X1 [Salvia divinorum]|uniref:Disease resistance proteinisoform X1 n=1 Tax=Salvia divinorum TaxID=28513 RepID=A0ABD1GZE4_SALDI
MVESVANVFLQSLDDLLVEEIEHLVGASDEAEQAKKDLQSIHSLLMKADSNRRESPTLRDHITQLKDLASKAENVLETSYAVKAAFNQEADQIEKFQRYICILRECYSVDKVRRDTRPIISSLSVLTNSLLLDMGHETETSSLSTATSLDHHFVGMEKDMELLLSIVKDESTRQRVVKISGMGGLGKTSLARKIYNHADLHSYARAWVCIHRHFQPKAVLAKILEQLDPNTHVNDGMGVDYLVRRIYKFVERRKSLVVIDDIWKNDGWEIMRKAFPINCNVFLITRSERVGSEECDHLYKLGFMTEDDGWALLQRIALPQDFGSVETLEGIGREIVVKCGLLPLAISVIGGILRHKKEDVLAEWKKVNMNLSDVEGVEEHERVTHVLELSYDALPYYLKPCFLYLACFPENEEIKTDKLYLLWMAEGFISHHDKGPNETLRDVAERYLTELATRHMVQVQKGDSPLHKFDSCRLHDLMLELCSSKVEEEKLFKHIDIPSLICNFISRVRSFMPLGKGGLSFQRIGSEDSTTGSERTLHSSRILEFKGDKLPSKVGKLILLRYLSLMDSGVRELPKFVCSMPYLQTLDLRVWSALRLPNVIWKMKRLKHLFLPREIQVIKVEKPRLGWLEVTEREKLRLDGLDELETLQHIDSKTARTKDILKLISLKEVCATVHDMDSLSAIIQQKSISSLRIAVEHCDLSSDVLKNALMCPSLVSLSLYTCKVVGAGFPCYEEGMAENVVDLNIRYCKVEGDLMMELGKFPRLQSLWLQGREVGRMMEMSVCSANSFPELKTLDLHRWPNLKKWEVEEGAMPKLSKLYIRTCWNLEKIPDGLRFIYGLRQLNIFKMSDEFTNRIREQGQDYAIVSHIPSFYIYGDPR